MNSSIQNIDGILPSTTNPCERGPESNDNKGVPCIFSNCRTRVAPKMLISVISKTLIGVGLTLFRGAVGVYYRVVCLDYDTLPHRMLRF